MDSQGRWEKSFVYLPYLWLTTTFDFLGPTVSSGFQKHVVFFLFLALTHKITTAWGNIMSAVALTNTLLWHFILCQGVTRMLVLPQSVEQTDNSITWNSAITFQSNLLLNDFQTTIILISDFLISNSCQNLPGSTYFTFHLILIFCLYYFIFTNPGTEFKCESHHIPLKQNQMMFFSSGKTTLIIKGTDRGEVWPLLRFVSAGLKLLAETGFDITDLGL